MTKHDKLLLQLSTAKTKIDDAINNKNSKLIIIHGVGKGVLKNELIKLFNSYSNIEYYDASFQDYGQGATEIKIYNN
jgi:dsDNA-specific endonuclease/ATPase MutS2